MKLILKIKKLLMSNNTTAGASGMITSFVLMIYSIPVQSMLEVFIFGLIGGIAGILGKTLCDYMIRKIRKLFKIKPPKTPKDDKTE